MREFLSKVLSDKGWYCIVGLRSGKPTKQIFVESLDEVEAVADQLMQDEYNAYFACAKYETNNGRVKENAAYFKSAWLDIDCGEGKDYPDQETAVNALVKFCNDNYLSVPTIVDSGRGLHVYFVWEEDVGREEWTLVAEQLKALCRQDGLYADPSVTADAARILRLPGSKNYKVDPPLDVAVLLEGETTTYEKHKSCMGVVPALPEKPDYISDEPSELQKSLQQNQIFRFSTILQKTADGLGCAQIQYIIERPHERVEPLWRAGLSIAKFCVDADVAIGIVSEGRSDYDYDVAVRKSEAIVGPYTCKTFEGLNPQACKKCAHRNSLTTPLRLGVEVLEAEEGETVLLTDPTGKTMEYTVPDIPSPYFRAKNRGIYCKTDDDSILIYENDLYLIKRMHDPVRGDLVLAKLHLPKDTPKEIIIPLSVLTSTEELRKLLASYGVISGGKSFTAIQNYLIYCAKQQQHSQEAEILRTQFGWVDDDTKFVLGTKEIHADEIRYSPPSEVTAPYAKLMHEKGEMVEWKQVVNTYNLPGFEPHAMAIFFGLGAPLMKFTGYNGLMVNLLNRESGTGKSTILKVINSIYGHPTDLMGQERDTLAHKMFRLGVSNNLPVTNDELTNMRGEDVSIYSYGVSNGRGPGRMQAQANMERKNDTTWATISISSSNSSLIEKLGAVKVSSTGETARIIEYQIDATNNLTKDEAYQLFEGQLMRNYGIAGVIFLQYCVKHKAEVLKLYEKTRAEFDAMAQFTNRERYYSAGYACAFTAAIIAHKLGLHDIDYQRVMQWAIANLVPENKNMLAQSRVTYKENLGDFINQNLSSILVINGPVNSGQPMPDIYPRDKLIIRIEPDTAQMFIATKPLREYCASGQLILRDMLRVLKNEGVFLGEVKKRMNKGTKLAGPPVKAYLFTIDETIMGLDDLLETVNSTNDNSRD